MSTRTSQPGRPFWTHQPGRRETVHVAAVALSVALVVAIVFTLWPELDIAVSGLFLGADGQFALNRPGFWPVLRRAIMNGYTVWYVAITAGCILAFTRRANLLGFGLHKWLYLAACSLAGPLLLVNVYLKDHWGRWRPREIIELGGLQLFTGPLQSGGSCLDNCSFVSGEVASMAMAFISLAFVTTAWRPVFYALTVVLGLFSALIRVGQGGHFLSDALFAGAFMALIAAALYWLFFLTETGRLFDDPQALRRHLRERHDAFWARWCERGLALLDRLFPRTR